MLDHKTLESMGGELSHKCSWNGLDILEVAIVALTDANFHREADVLNQMVEALTLANAEHEIFYRLDVSEETDEIPPF